MDASSLISQVLDLALKSGAQAAEVFQSDSLSRLVFFETNRLKQLERSQSSGIALRLWKNGAPGLAVAHGPVDAQRLVDKAIALSQLNQAEAIELAVGSAIAYPDVGAEVSVEQMIEWGKEAIALVLDAYPDVICEGEWDCEAEQTRLVNTNGLDVSYTDTTLSGYLAAEWIRGDDFLGVSDGQTRRFKLDPVTLANPIVQRLHWSENNVAPPVGRSPVLFTAKASDMLWGTIQSALNGKQVLEQSSPWSDRLGEQVISSKLNLAQRPKVGPYSCPFDDEGTHTQPITFIKDGVLQLFYCDRTIGNALGTGTTGNGFRPGLGGYPTPGLVNLLVQRGSASFEQLIQSMRNGLIIDQILGGGAGISGDFSVNVDLGYRVENGVIVGRVKDTMVSGNVYTALKQDLELGNDASWNGACFTPSIVVNGLSTTGRQ